MIERLAFVGVDPNYALGPERWIADYSVVCRHETPALRLMEARGIAVFCLERAVGRERLPGRDTAALLGHPEVLAWLRAWGPQSLLVFKPNARVEAIAASEDWPVLGARAAVARPMENKVNFFKQLEARGLPHPRWREIDPDRDSYATLAADIGTRLIVQAAHGFSGNRTFAVDDADQYAAVAQTLGRRKARAAELVEGSPVTMNACVLADGAVRTGPLFHQVTGAPECTVYPFGACGNDWVASPADPEPAAAIARAVGEMLAERGFRGIFGMDFVLKPDGGVVAIECNPRLVSSVPMASALEIEAGAVPLLLSHLEATSGESGERGDVRVPIRGAQLVLHNLTGSAARVDGELAAGIYRMDDGLRFVRPALVVTECADDEFLLLPPARGHVLQAAGECARVQMRSAVLQFEAGVGRGPGTLTDAARATARAVYGALQLEPIEGGVADDDD